jgi:hypothetical protein
VSWLSVGRLPAAGDLGAGPSAVRIRLRRDVLNAAGLADRHFVGHVAGEVLALRETGERYAADDVVESHPDLLFSRSLSAAHWTRDGRYSQ